MILDDNTNNLIEDFLDGKLDDQAKEAFDQRLIESLELRRAVDLEKLIRANIVKSEEAELRMKMKNIHQKHISDKTTKSKKVIPMSKKLFPILSIAATLLILVGAFFMFQTSDTGSDQTDPLSKYFKSKKTYTQSALSSFGTRGGSATDEDEKIKKLKSIFTLIDKGNYAKAKTILDSYIAEYPEDEEAKYAKAKIYLDEADYGNAIAWFSKVRKSDNRELRNEAEFYYGLCHFMTVDGESEAKTVLEGVTKDNRSEWQAAAKDVLANR